MSWLRLTIFVTVHCTGEMNILPCYLNGRLSTCKKPWTTSRRNISRAPDRLRRDGMHFRFVGKSQYSWGDWEIHTAKGGDIVSNECVFVACMEEIKTENNILGEKTPNSLTKVRVVPSLSLPPLEHKRSNGRCSRRRHSDHRRLIGWNTGTYIVVETVIGPAAFLCCYSFRSSDVTCSGDLYYSSAVPLWNGWCRYYISFLKPYACAHNASRLPSVNFRSWGLWYRGQENVFVSSKRVLNAQAAQCVPFLMVTSLSLASAAVCSRWM